MTLAMLLAAMAAMQGEPLVHRMEVTAGGRPLRLEYRATTVTDVRQRGIAPPGRISTERCDWTVSLAVRRVSGPLPAVGVASDWRQRGSVAGNCRIMRRAIAAQVADRSGAARKALVAAAEADAARLLAQSAMLTQGVADE